MATFKLAKKEYVVSEEIAKKYQNNDIENVPEKKSKDNVCSKCSTKIKKQ